MVTGFSNAVNKIMSEPGNQSGVVVHRERHKLEFKVQPNLSLSLQVFAHDNPAMQKIGQHYFACHIVMTGVERLRVPKVEDDEDDFTVFASPLKPTAMANDPYEYDLYCDDSMTMDVEAASGAALNGAPHHVSGH
jgi:hypothetical protein